MSLFIALLYLLAAILGLLGILFFTLFLLNALFVDAPYVPVQKRVLQKIIETLQLTPTSVLYDIGCGDARVLLEAVHHVQGVEAIGIEKNLSVYMWTKRRTRKDPVTILWGDVRNVSLQKATHIYIYLYPKVMNELLPKLKRECAPGTRIVSCDFMFTDLVPDETVELPLAHDGLCKKLHVYTLR